MSLFLKFLFPIYYPSKCFIILKHREFKLFKLYDFLRYSVERENNNMATARIYIHLTVS
jgi:hypothetical protein